jgi:large subunit ribosomal protein L9
MKVILKENVEHLGHIGDIVKVAPGYARNYLLPKGLVVEATERNAKALEHTKRHLEYKKNKVLESARGLAARIEALALSITHHAGEEGKLFGAVTTKELAEKLHEAGIEMDRKKIVADPIKHTGDYAIPVKIHPEITATLKITIVAAE